jgi:rhodanese-related sulfurtransferase
MSVSGFAFFSKLLATCQAVDSGKTGGDVRAGAGKTDPRRLPVAPLATFAARLAMALLGTVILASPACADFRVTIGSDPADDQYRQNLALGNAPTPSMSAALGLKVFLRQTTNLTDVLRASRTQENDALIGPAHVTASALNYGYRLLARDPRNARFVLVAHSGIKDIEGLSGKRLYLTQQDSLRAYLARGLLAEAGFDMRKLNQIVYGKTTGAGLLALDAGLADATVAEQNEAAAWIKAHPGRASILVTSREVPYGNAVVVLERTPENDRRNLLRWSGSPEAGASGLPRQQAAGGTDLEAYRYIASLAIQTPPALPGATLVDAVEVARLVKAGALAVDTRTPSEFEREHIAGAINLPYVESSLKERDFNPALDDFRALERAPKGRALIFFCNGPECWKSYKAAKVAVSRGMPNIYWYRKGMPDWREKSLAIEGASRTQ